MSTARKLRLELAAYLEPFGLSVQGGTHGTLKSRPGSRAAGAQVFDGDHLLTNLTLDKPEDVLSAVRHVHKLRPDVPLLVKPKPPRASRSRKAPAPTAPVSPRPVAELDALFDEPADEGDTLSPCEGEAAFVERLAEDMPTTQAPPWDAIAAAATAAAARRVPGAGLMPRRLYGCEVIARVRSLGHLDDDVPVPLVDAAADGLRRSLPTWLVRDEGGRLSVLVTNREPVAA